MSLRIDAPIKPTSHLRLLLYIGLTLALIVLAWQAPLRLWQYVMIMIVYAAVVCSVALLQPILLHLSQPPLSQPVDKGWQLLMRTARGDALWQAKLLKVHRYQLLIHFEFMVLEPYQKPLSVSVFRDQMSPEQWRELNVLATVF